MADSPRASELVTIDDDIARPVRNVANSVTVPGLPTENRMMADNHKNWTCPKCGNKEYDTSKFSATKGMLSKLVDVQTEKFTTVTCERCQYTEIYRLDSSLIGKAFDFFT